MKRLATCFALASLFAMLGCAADVTDSTGSTSNAATVTNPPGCDMTKVSLIPCNHDGTGGVLSGEGGGGGGNGLAPPSTGTDNESCASAYIHCVKGCPAASVGWKIRALCVSSCQDEEKTCDGTPTTSPN